MSIESYHYLWDGSDEGWVLQHTDHVVWTVTFVFSTSGPSKDEIVALRKLVPEFRDKKLSSVLSKIKGLRDYKVEYLYGNIEVKRLEREVANFSLKYKIDAVQIGGYLPVSKENMVLLIEDEQTNMAVCKKMLEAGVPVVCHTHID